MSETTTALDSVRDYYLTRRDGGHADRTILEIWEAGEAFNDSITPSTFVPEYRSHMVLKILSLTAPDTRIFSIGCGNAFVEAELARSERDVVAVDYLDEAVGLARNKGITAYTADFFDLTGDDLAGTGLVYADGLLGHLLGGDEGIDVVLDTLERFGLASGTTLVISNDSPRDPGVAIAPHERVPGFWFVSRSYLREVLAARGWTVVEDYYFPYVRPVSGLRNRSICVARVP